MKRIPNYNTLADIIDRLIVEINKLSWFENKKREESVKDSPNSALIALWDKNSRHCCEYRDLLKREFDKTLTEIISTNSYETLSACRTFSAPPKTALELIEEICDNTPEAVRRQLSSAFEYELTRNK
jgi:hypothetical protein